MVDRILYQFSKRYFECNLAVKGLYKSTGSRIDIDIVYGILFSLVLLNTDLHIVNVGPNGHKRMPLKQFLKNTMDLVDDMMTKDEEIKSLVGGDLENIKKWKRDLDIHLKGLYQSVRDDPIMKSNQLKEGSSQSLLKSGRADSQGSVSSMISNAKHTITKIGNSFKKSDGLINSPSSDGSVRDDVILEGVLIRKHYMEQEQRARNRRWIKVWVSLRLCDLGAQLIQYYMTGRLSENEYEPIEVVEKPFYSKTAKSPGVQFNEEEISFGTPLGAHPILASPAQMYKLVAQEPELLSLIHAVSYRIEYSDERQNAFSLSLCDGQVFLFQATSLESCQTWVEHINYFSARKSKAPMRGGITNADYGWSSGSPNVESPKIKKLETWTAPTLSNRLVSDLNEVILLI